MPIAEADLAAVLFHLEPHHLPEMGAAGVEKPCMILWCLIKYP